MYVCLCVCLRSFYEFLQQSEMRKRNETRFTIRSQFIKGNLVVWVLLILFASQLTWFCARVFFREKYYRRVFVCFLPTFQKFRRLAANRTIVFFTLHSKPYLSSVRFAPLFVALMHSVVNFYAKSRLFVFLSRVCGRLLRGKKKEPYSPVVRARGRNLPHAANLACFNSFLCVCLIIFSSFAALFITA